MLLLPTYTSPPLILFVSSNPSRLAMSLYRSLPDWLADNNPDGLEAFNNARSKTMEKQRHRMTESSYVFSNPSDAPSSTADHAKRSALGEELPTTLLDLLSNTLVLDHTVTYLDLQSLMRLSTTSRAFQALVLQTPLVFRYLNLSRCKGATVPVIEPIDSGGEVWRSQRMDESLTEDDFYSGPLRGVFSNLSRMSILRDVQVMVLDGLSVTMELISEILSSEKFNVRILSIIGCRNLNERKLQQLLRYACRPNRPEGTPRLKGLYFFGTRENLQARTAPSNHGVMSSEGAQLGSASTGTSQR